MDLCIRVGAAIADNDLPGEKIHEERQVNIDIIVRCKLPFAGLSDPRQRQDVIAYLAQLAQGGATKY